MDKWEYIRLNVCDEFLMENMKDVGEAGFELVLEKGDHLYFKRFVYVD